MSDLTALHALQSDEERRKYARYFKAGAEEFIGVRMGHVFELARQMIALPRPKSSGSWSRPSTRPEPPDERARYLGLGKG